MVPLFVYNKGSHISHNEFMYLDLKNTQLDSNEHTSQRFVYLKFHII